MNNLVYFWDCSRWAYNCDIFFGYWGITLYITSIFLRTILAGSMIVIVFWAIENNLV